VPSHAFRLCQAVALAAGLASCAPAGGTPSLDPIANQTAYVGVEFSLELRASDSDRDELFYTFSSNIPDLSRRAQIRPFGDGSNAQFVWTPAAADVGRWAIDIRVTDGEHETVETLNLEVKASEGVGAPVFRKPLGTGATLDLTRNECLDLEVVVDDADATSLILGEGEPRIEGAKLDQTGDFTATWSWCPSAAQIDAMDRYPLVLSADDGQGPATLKNFLVVLRRPQRPNCEGEPPVITHVAENVSTQLSLELEADIADELGLKDAPLLYFSTTPPPEPVDLGAMQQVTMALVSGDNRSGRWRAEVPNPVATAVAGTSQSLYYVIVASDNDDVDGDCDHVSQTTAFKISVTNPGGQGELGLCEARAPRTATAPPTRAARRRA
jgi:hypothetical protein